MFAPEAFDRLASTYLFRITAQALRDFSRIFVEGADLRSMLEKRGNLGAQSLVTQRDRFCCPLVGSPNRRELRGILSLRIILVVDQFVVQLLSRGASDLMIDVMAGAERRKHARH